MLPDLRFVFVAVFCSVVLLFGAVGLMASRIAVNPLSQHALREHSSPLVLAEGPRMVEGHSSRREELHGLLSIQLGPAEARASAIPPETPRRAAPAEVAALTASPTVMASAGAPGGLAPVVVRALPAAGSVLPPVATTLRTAVPPAGAEFIAETVAPPTVLLASLSLSTTPWLQADFELSATILLPPQPDLPAIAMTMAPQAVAALLAEEQSFAAAAAQPAPQETLGAPVAALPAVAGAQAAAPAPPVALAAASAALPASAVEASRAIDDVPWPPHRRAGNTLRSHSLRATRSLRERPKALARAKAAMPRSRVQARVAQTRTAQARAKARRAAPTGQQLQRAQQLATQNYWAQQQRNWNAQWQQQQRAQRRTAGRLQTQ